MIIAKENRQTNIIASIVHPAYNALNYLLAVVEDIISRMQFDSLPFPSYFAQPVITKYRVAV